MWIITSYPKLDSYQIDSEIAAGRISVGEKKIAGVETITPNEVEKRRKSEELANSIAGGMGRAMEPIIKPLGFDWKIGTAIVGAFAAKEVFVAQMGIIYSMEETGEEFESLRCGLRRDYSSLTGFSLMLFLLISAPCMATIAVTRRESGGWKWALVQFGGLTIIAYVISFLFFQIGRFFM
jgi:ferrous iron transport protein B